MDKILIIDDEKKIREYLADMAREINNTIDILTASTSKEALEIAKEKDIKVFFIDIKLGNEDGIELAQMIRSIKKYKFTMIIFITSYANRRLEAFEDTHCYDFIIKEFGNEKKLKRTMKKMLIEYLSSQNQCEELNLEFKFQKFQLKYDNIICIEYKKRRINIITNNKKIKYKYMSLKNFKKKLPVNFIQINQYFIVNKMYIEEINKKDNSIKIQGLEGNIEYSRNYQKEVEGLIDETY